MLSTARCWLTQSQCFERRRRAFRASRPTYCVAHLLCGSRIAPLLLQLMLLLLLRLLLLSLVLLVSLLLQLLVLVLLLHPCRWIIGRLRLGVLPSLLLLAEGGCHGCLQKQSGMLLLRGGPLLVRAQREAGNGVCSGPSGE